MPQWAFVGFGSWYPRAESPNGMTNISCMANQPNTKCLGAATSQLLVSVHLGYKSLSLVSSENFVKLWKFKKPEQLEDIWGEPYHFLHKI